MLTNLLDIEKNDYTENIFRGTVVDNNDPLKLERVRVSIAGLYESNDISLIPWCISFKRISFGSGAGYGEFSVPRLGSIVAVMLQQGDPHFPIYLGSLLQAGNTVTEAGVNYPHRYGFKDPVGNLFYIDMQSGIVKFQHKSGTVITINNDGSVVTHIVSSVNLTIDGPVTATITGDVTANVTGNVNLTTTGNLVAMIGGLASIIATGAALVQGATVVVQGATVALQNAGTALKKLVNDTFIALFNNHVHSGVQGGGSNTGTPTTTASSSNTTSVTQAE